MSRLVSTKPHLVALVVLLTTLLVDARDARAQDDSPADARIERAFRDYVARDLGWRPRRGVSLPTPKFARKHARTYPEAEPAERRQCPTPRTIADEMEGIALFQTSKVDVFVVTRKIRTQIAEDRGELRIFSSDLPVCLYERGNPVGVRIGIAATTYRRAHKIVFYEATGALPMELKGHSRGGCGTNCGFEKLTIHALDSNEMNPIYEMAFGRDYLPSIPNASFWDMKIAHKPAGPDDWFIVEYHPMLLVNSEWLPPPHPFQEEEPDEPRRPLIRERCRRENVGEEMSCQKEVIGKVKVNDLKPFLSGATWRQNARAITYFIEHQDELRERGFIIEPEFIERLERHLPESMREKDE